MILLLLHSFRYKILVENIIVKGRITMLDFEKIDSLTIEERVEFLEALKVLILK